MKTNEVDATVESLQQVQQLFRMHDGIVHAVPTYIFETDTPLMRPVVLFEQRHHIVDRHHLLRRHDSCSFCRERIVKRDRQVTFTLVQEPLHRRDTDGRDGDSFG